MAQVCRSCSIQNEHDARFCKSCGSPLLGAERAAPTSAGASVATGSEARRRFLRLPRSRGTRIVTVAAALAVVGTAVAIALALSGGNADVTAEVGATEEPEVRDTDGDGLPNDVDPDPFSSANTPIDEFEDVPSETDEQEPDQTYKDVRQAAPDGDVTFKVESLGPVPMIAGDEFNEPIRPTANAQLIEAKVKVKNNGQTNADPFCGTTGAVLLDESDRNFQLHDDTISIPGNDICGDGVAPGFQATWTLAFEMPQDSSIGGLVVWNSEEEGDTSGNVTQLVFLP